MGMVGAAGALQKETHDQSPSIKGGSGVVGIMEIQRDRVCVCGGYTMKEMKLIELDDSGIRQPGSWDGGGRIGEQYPNLEAHKLVTSNK